jgi:hypothetical protein
LIGDNGGGEGIFIRFGDDESPVYLIGLGTMQIEDGTLLSTTVQGWVEKHFPLRQKNNHTYPNIVDVYLTSLPSGGVHELLRLKHILNINMAIMELRKGVEHLPFRLLRAVPFWKYVKLVLLYDSRNTCLALLPVDKTDHSIPLPSLILDDNKNSAESTSQ